MGRGESPDAFPGWPRIEADLKAAAGAGDDVKLSAVETMAVLGEVGRLRDRVADATRLLRMVEFGSDCWGSEQGYAPCQFRGIDRFIAGEPKRRRWWRRG